MPVSKILIAGGLAGAALLGFLALGGTAHAATPVAPKPGQAPTQKGTADGCAAGTADASASKAMADLSSVATTLATVASASGNAPAYIAAYTVAYADCYAKTPKPTKAMPTLYTLKAGDDPVKVAAKFGVTIADLAAANPDLKWGLTNQDVATFTNAVNGSVIPGTSEGQIDAAGTLNVTPTFTPTYGIVGIAENAYPVYDSNTRIKGGSNNYVYFPYGKAGQPYAAGGGNPGGGRVFYADSAWRWVAAWRTGQIVQIPTAGSAVATSGLGAMVAGFGTKVGGMFQKVTGRTLVGSARPGMGLVQRTGPYNPFASGVPIPGAHSENYNYGFRFGQATYARACRTAGGRLQVDNWVGGAGDDFVDGFLAGVFLAGGGLSDVPRVGGPPVWVGCTRKDIGGALTAGTNVSGAVPARKPTTHPMGWPAPPVRR